MEFPSVVREVLRVGGLLHRARMLVNKSSEVPAGQTRQARGVRCGPMGSSAFADRSL